MSSGPSTPKLGLHTYTSLDDMDYTEVNSDQLAIDTLATVTVCTSVTRPSTLLYPGREIYETDTKRKYMYTGTAWVMTGYTPASVRRRRTTTVAVATGATVDVDNFQTSEYSFNGADISYAAGVFTVNVGGLFRWDATCEWQSVASTGSGTGRRRIFLKKNGVAVYDGPTDDMPDNGQSLNSGFRQTASGTADLVSGDDLRVSLFNSTGAAAVVDTGMSFAITRLY